MVKVLQGRREGRVLLFKAIHDGRGGGEPAGVGEGFKLAGDLHRVVGERDAELAGQLWWDHWATPGASARRARSEDREEAWVRLLERWRRGWTRRVLDRRRDSHITPRGL